MGAGMLSKDCEDCDGQGKIKEITDEIDYVRMKKTEAYQSARKRLNDKYPDLSKDEVEVMLDEAFDTQIAEQKTRRGRPKKIVDKELISYRE